jgi:hypothetical protein
MKQEILHKWSNELQFGWNSKTGEPWFTTKCFAREAYPALCGKFSATTSTAQANIQRPSGNILERAASINRTFRSPMREIQGRRLHSPLAGIQQRVRH